MKKLFILFISVSLTIVSHAADIYKPVQEVALRAPSVPLITSDTYFSIWSPYNKLTEGATEHWTGEAHPLIGAIRVDGKTYRFMGKDKLDLPFILPNSETKNWDAEYTTERPGNNWESVNFNDATWKKGRGAFGSAGSPGMKTLWDSKDIWIRRTFDLNEDLSKEILFLKYSHDDDVTIYINGIEIVNTGNKCESNVLMKLPANAIKALVKGKNVIAVHCYNRVGPGYIDFGLFRLNPDKKGFELEAIQKSVNVLPTQTYYTFTCGAVELDLVFTAPLLLDDLDLVSAPINYISYRVRALDKKKHDVQIYIETTPQLAVNDISQPVISERIEKNGMVYLKTGTIDQPITIRKGDGVRIDWGYAYLASDNANNKALSLGEYYSTKDEFIKSGKLKPSIPTKDLPKNLSESMTALPIQKIWAKLRKMGNRAM